jgi:hypothetical protein
MLGPKPIIVPPRLPWEPVEVELTWHEKLRSLPRSRWVILGLSFLVTAVIVLGFVVDAKKNMPTRTLTLRYFQSWPATRNAQDLATDRAAEKADYARQFAASRAYIATLPPAEQAAARDQYNAFAASLGPSLRPDDFVPPKPVVPVSAATPAAPRK